MKPNKSVEKEPTQPSTPGRVGNQKWSRLLNSRGLMFAMLFCVTGFLGIPFLWKSEAFSRAEKIVWSLIVIVYTSILIWITASIVMWSYRSIRDTLG